MTNKIPYYKGNIKLSKVIGHVSLSQFIFAIKNPRANIKKLIDEIAITKDSVLKRELKHQLYSFTVSVFVPYYKKRSYKNIQYFTGLMQLDFDKVNGSLEDLKIELYLKPYVICVFYSPSRNGLKAICLTKVPRNVEHYKAIHKAVKTDLNIDSFDDATNNPILPLFLSYDEEIYHKPIDKVIAFDKEDFSKPEFVVPLTVEQTKYIPNFNNYEKTLRIFKSKINSIQENGHPQVVKACLILGSRVAAEYIGYNEALTVMQTEIRNNEYLKKGTNGYLKTGLFFINKGYNNGARYY